MEKFRVKKEKGITLIALVVTIIVMLILAGVTLSMLTGENGIIIQAKNAKERTDIATIKEEAELVKTTLVMDALSNFKKSEELEKIILLNALKEHFNGSLGNNMVITEDNKYAILVDDDLNITVKDTDEIKDNNKKGNEIKIISNVVSNEEKTVIELYFDIDGKKNIQEFFIEYLDKKEPDKEAGDLEEMYAGILKELGEEITFDDDIRSSLQKEATQMGFTYEQYLKIMIIEIEIEQTNGFNMVEIIYEYFCEYFNETPKTDATDLENQSLRIFELEGSFEDAIDSLGTSRDELQKQAAANDMEYADYLKQMIVQYCFEYTEINVTVSNGENFQVNILDLYKEYEVTSNGEYKFIAETMEGLKGETSVVVGDIQIADGPITNPYDKDEWEVGWTCTNGTTWSDLIINDGTTVLEGDGIITAKLYNTGEPVKPKVPESLGGSELDSGDGYKLVIEGIGNMASLNIDMGQIAWQKYGLFSGNNTTLYALYITEVLICDGITNIGDSAFYGCISLKNVKISKTVENIESSVFGLCHKLTTKINIPETMTSIPGNIFFGCTSLTDVIIHENITNIGDSAFNGCESLHNLSIPPKVTNIGRNAFYNSGIIEAIIPNGVEAILYDTFGSCDNLVSVSIPSSVTTLGEFAFEQCRNLKEITIPNNVTSIGMGAFRECNELVNITLSSNITKIDSDLFKECTKLKTISIPNNVTTIGVRAFADCTGLETVTMADGVTYIDQEAFYNCTTLSSVKFSANLKEFNSRAFYNCTALTTITIPSLVENIGISVFENCSSLKTVRILSTSKWFFVATSAFMGLPSGSYIYVPNTTIKSAFTDGTNYTSANTTVTI